MDGFRLQQVDLGVSKSVWPCLERKGALCKYMNHRTQAAMRHGNGLARELPPSVVRHGPILAQRG